MTAQPATILRKTDRFAMAIPARIKPFGATKSERVTMSDLSAVGCQLTPALEYRAGGQLLVKLPGLDYRPATIVWRRQDRLGIEFRTPLHPRSVETFARQVAEWAGQAA